MLLYVFVTERRKVLSIQTIFVLISFGKQIAKLFVAENCIWKIFYVWRYLNDSPIQIIVALECVIRKINRIIENGTFNWIKQTDKKLDSFDSMLHRLIWLEHGEVQRKSWIFIPWRFHDHRAVPSGCKVGISVSWISFPGKKCRPEQALGGKKRAWTWSSAGEHWYRPRIKIRLRFFPVTSWSFQKKLSFNRWLRKVV